MRMQSTLGRCCSQTFKTLMYILHVSGYLYRQHVAMSLEWWIASGSLSQNGPDSGLWTIAIYSDIQCNMCQHVGFSQHAMVLFWVSSLPWGQAVLQLQVKETWLGSFAAFAGGSSTNHKNQRTVRIMGMNIILLGQPVKCVLMEWYQRFGMAECHQWSSVTVAWSHNMPGACHKRAMSTWAGWSVRRWLKQRCFSNSLTCFQHHLNLL